MNKLLTIKEAAFLLSVSAWKMRKWDKEGKLKALIINKRGDRRYKEEDIENFINKL